MHRRSDNSRWALPGGVMDIGESIGDTVVREVREETGLEVVPEYIVGVYSDPGHVFAYSDGEVRQQFSICFACRLLRGEIRVSDESTEVAFFAPADLDQLDIHPSIRLRLKHYVEAPPRAVIGWAAGRIFSHMLRGGHPRLPQGGRSRPVWPLTCQGHRLAAGAAVLHHGSQGRDGECGDAVAGVDLRPQ